MSWFRFSSLVFAFWFVVFFFFPRFSNEFAGVGYTSSGHAEDWTRLIGLFSLGFAVLLDAAHRSASSEVRRSVAYGVVAFALPCALLMTYWQIIPERRWFRLDILNIMALYVMAFGLFTTLRGRSSP
jgi:hypothetical protein